MKVNTYSLQGKKLEATTLPKEILADSNMQLLAQAIRVYENRQHQGLSKVKTRGVMTISTRKIYKQKGTGGARHGAKSAPIFVGGGIAHGPTGVKRTLEMPQKMRVKALQVALGEKANEGTLVMVEGLAKLTKTKEAQNLINSVRKETGSSKDSKFTFVLGEGNLGTLRYLRNLRNIAMVPYRNLNAHDVFKGGVVVIDSEALGEKSQIPMTNVKKGKKTEKVESSKTVKTNTTNKTMKKASSAKKVERKKSVKSVKKSA